MTAFDLHALGWVVTRDAFWEIARSLSGRTPRLPLAAMPGLTERWQRLQVVAAETSGPLWTRLVSSPLLRPMSAETCAAAAEYLTFLCTSCPELYSLHVVGERCRRARVQAFVGLGGSLLVGSLAGPTNSLAADVAVVLLVMGAWYLTTFFQLRSVRKLVSRLARRSSFSAAPGLLP